MKHYLVIMTAWIKDTDRVSRYYKAEIQQMNSGVIIKGHADRAPVKGQHPISKYWPYAMIKNIEVKDRYGQTKYICNDPRHLDLAEEFSGVIREVLSVQKTS